MAQISPSEVPSIIKSSGCHFDNSATVMCYLCSLPLTVKPFLMGKWTRDRQDVYGLHVMHSM